MKTISPKTPLQLAITGSLHQRGLALALLLVLAAEVKLPMRHDRACAS